MPATIFSGNDVKSLSKNLDLNGGGKIISSTTDPTSSAVDAPKGSLLVNESNGYTYRKTDAGSSTNWNNLGYESMLPTTWTTFTPTCFMTIAGGITAGIGNTYGTYRYNPVTKVCQVRGVIYFNNALTPSGLTANHQLNAYHPNSFTQSLQEMPNAVNNGQLTFAGSGNLLDASANVYYYISLIHYIDSTVTPNLGTGIRFFGLSTTAIGQLTFLTATTPITIANGDRLNYAYEMNLT